MHASAAVVGGILFLLAAACPSVAGEDIFATSTGAGQLVVLGHITEVDKSCSPTNTVRIKVLRAPQHGVLATRAAMVNPSYPSSDKVLYRCNTRVVPGIEQTYTPEADYAGPDVVDFLVLYSHGKSQHVHVTITVDPPTPPSVVDVNQSSIDPDAADSGALSDGALLGTPILGVTSEYKVPAWAH